MNVTHEQVSVVLANEGLNVSNNEKFVEQFVDIMDRAGHLMVELLCQLMNLMNEYAHNYDPEEAVQFQRALPSIVSALTGQRAENYRVNMEAAKSDPCLQSMRKK